jgi:hypothetical protein
MSNYRQSVREYIRACELLLEVPSLTLDEQEAVEKMIGRLTENMRGGTAGNGA